MFSVIIPVYNAEKYINECLVSVCGDTTEEIEVIVVNDESSDKSLEIIQQFAERDSRVHVIDKKNEGVSVARNAGIDSASKDYILFVDADDFLESGWYEALKQMIEGKHPDFIFGDYNEVNSENKVVRYTQIIKADKYERSDIDRMFVATPLLNTCWAKVYKTQVIKDNAVQFPVGVRVGEDVSFVKQYLSHCKSVEYMNKSLYRYRQLDTGAVRVNRVLLDEKTANEIGFVFQEKLQYIQERGLNKDAVQDFYKEYTRAISAQINLAMKNRKDSDFRLINSEITSFVKADAIKEILRLAGRKLPFGAKEGIIAKLFQNSVLRYLYVYVKYMKYRKQ